MGLPQEVVDRIMDMFQDNRRTIEACSLTYKVIFASTQHLIHQMLHVTRKNNQRMLTPEEKKQYTPGVWLLELRFLSFMGERDLLIYARRLNISIGYRVFSPSALGPHLRYFRSLDRINTLTIHSFDAVLLYDVYNTHFTQCCLTLTTLALHSPEGHYRFLLQFALQLPNLENLTIEYLRHERRMLSRVSVPPIVTKSPPLREHLWRASLGPEHPEWTREFAFDLPNGINFPSVEFQDVHWERGQQILDECAGSLEGFTVRTIGNGERELLPHLFYAAGTERTVSYLRDARTGPSPIQ